MLTVWAGGGHPNHKDEEDRFDEQQCGKQEQLEAEFDAKMRGIIVISVMGFVPNSRGNKAAANLRPNIWLAARRARIEDRGKDGLCTKPAWRFH